jgi:hypothetical protein
MGEINAKKMLIKRREGLLGGPGNKWEEGGPINMNLINRM